MGVLHHAEYIYYFPFSIGLVANYVTRYPSFYFLGANSVPTFIKFIYDRLVFIIKIRYESLSEINSLQLETHLFYRNSDTRTMTFCIVLLTGPHGEYVDVLRKSC